MSRRNRKSITARCVECESRVFFNRTPELGMVVTCHECGTKLEVIDHDPIELDWAYDDTYEEAYSRYQDFEY
ncbi:MAG: hypothetical protein R3293_23695 [Candidatus Promineifilaceae bacterium]|nr:hypothetical protein [Candidatus Promineifilaceae bacterium]